MTTSGFERRYSPLIILALLALLVTTIALWTLDRVAGTGGQQSGPAQSEADVIRWKMVTTWPKNFPGLGLAPENFSRMVEEMSGGRLVVQVYNCFCHMSLISLTDGKPINFIFHTHDDQ